MSSEARTVRGGAHIRVAGLHKQYGERRVLDDVQLELGAGEFVVLVGRSGTGKSTLLRILCGLEEPDAGVVSIRDPEAPHVSPEVRMVFQEPRLLPWRTVLRNVRIGGAPEERARELLTRVGLADRAHDYPHVLSGGQRQRVALARALVHEPKLMLFDEPFGALDALTRMEAQQLVESLWLRHGFSALLVTHDVEEAVLLADRVWVIEGGRIAQRVTLDLPRPRSRSHARIVEAREILLAAILGGASESASPAEPVSDVPVQGLLSGSIS